MSGQTQRFVRQAFTLLIVGQMAACSTVSDEISGLKIGTDAGQVRKVLQGSGFQIAESGLDFRELSERPLTLHLTATKPDETVTALFTPTGAPVLLGLQREIRFPTGEQQPSAEALLSKLKRQYGEPAPWPETTYDEYQWFFDPAGKPAQRPAGERCSGAGIQTYRYESALRRVLDSAKNAGSSPEYARERATRSGLSGKPECGHFVYARFFGGREPGKVSGYQLAVRDYGRDAQLMLQAFDAGLKWEENRQKEIVEKAKAAPPPRL